MTNYGLSFPPHHPWARDKKVDWDNANSREILFSTIVQVTPLGCLTDYFDKLGLRLSSSWKLVAQRQVKN
jgi:hypothetical protein